MPVVCFGRNVGECWRIHRLKPVRSLCYQEAFMIVPLTPVRCLYRGVDLYGKKVGVVSGASRATYAQFGERCERLAAGIVAEGILPGDRVAYLSFNNNALLEGYYGVVLARGVVMPLNVRLTPLELVAILNHSEARMLIFESDFTPLVEHIRKACPAIARYVGITEAGDEAGALADFTYEEMLARGRMEGPGGFSFDGDAQRGDAVAPHAVPARPGGGRHVQSRRYGGGTAYHPVVPRQRVGPAAGLHHDGSQAGDGAAVRAGAGLPADSGGEGHGHVPGADHGERAAERAGYGAVRSLQSEGDSRGRRGGLAGADRAPRTGFPLRGHGRLRTHGDLSGSQFGTAQGDRGVRR